jgi:hypothetical protein
MQDAIPPGLTCVKSAFDVCVLGVCTVPLHTKNEDQAPLNAWVSSPADQVHSTGGVWLVNSTFIPSETWLSESKETFNEFLFQVVASQ